MRSNSSAAPPEEYAGRHEGDLDLRILGAAVWRKRRWIILPTLIAFALSLAYVQTVAPLYKSTAMLLLERGESTFTRPDGTERDQNVIDQETVASQVQLIESRDLARRVVNDLKLADNPDFMPGEGFSLGQLLKAVGIGGSGQQRAREEQAIDVYSENLLVYPMDKTRVIGVEFSSRSPDLAARVVNAVTDAYLELQRGAKQEQNRQATQWLAIEIESMRKRVEEAEAQVAARRTGANLLLGANNTTLVTQQLGETNALLARARTAQADAEAKARLLREMIRSGRGFDSIEIGNSELIRRLTEQRVTLQATMASEGRTLLGGHPRMKELTAQIAGLDAQIKVEAERQTRIYENEAKAAAARVESLSRELDEQKRLATTANEDDVQLRALEREAKAQRDLLEQFLGRYREASARESMDAMPADARVISRGAVPSQPYFPKKPAIVLLATVAALVMSFALIGAGELFMGSATAAPDRRRAEAPMALGEVPVYGRLRRLGRDRPEASTSLAAARQKVDAADSEVVDALATQLAETAVDGRGMRILIAAATPVAEAGQVALALARAITDAGRRVVVIEVADQVPGLGSGVGPGLAQLIDASASFADVIHRDPRSRVHFIPRGSSSLVLGAEGAERLAIAVDALGLTYDFVILIGPPGESQLATLAALSDSAILVAAGGAGDAATVAAHERLVATGLDDVVVLLSHRPDPPDGKERLAA